MSGHIFCSHTNLVCFEEYDAGDILKQLPLKTCNAAGFTINKYFLSCTKEANRFLHVCINIVISILEVLSILKDLPDYLEGSSYF